MSRPIPQMPVGPWAPPSYQVDEDGKLVGARAEAPNNWGRWGEDDQQGTVNLLTPERIVAATRLIRTGKRFSLGMPIGPPAPSFRADPLHLFRHTTSDSLLNDAGMVPGMQISDDYLVMALQGTSQIDGLGHIGADDSLYNGFWSGAVTASSGARRLGVHHLREGLVGRGVLLDVARHLGLDFLETGTAIGPELLDDTCRSQGVEVSAGDILFVRTGFVGWWFRDPQHNRQLGVTGLLSGGLTGRTLWWLAEHDVAMVGADNLAVEGAGIESDGPVGFHQGAIRNLGLPLGELLDLDALADDCAADGVYEFFVVVSPLPLVNGAGSPINPIAIK